MRQPRGNGRCQSELRHKTPQLEFGEKLICLQLPLFRAVSEEFYRGGGDSQWPHPFPFSLLPFTTQRIHWCYSLVIPPPPTIRNDAMYCLIPLQQYQGGNLQVL